MKALLAHETTAYNAAVANLGPSGGQSMIFQFADGSYLIRFLVPASPEVRHGKYSEGFAMDFITALTEAIAGLNP